MTATPRRRLALVAALLFAASLTPGITPANAYLTAERFLPGNSLTTAHLTVEGLSATRIKGGMTTISWNDATTQPWAKARGITGDIHYTATSKTPDGCYVPTTTQNSITGSWPAGADCTISYTYAGWTASSTATVPFATVDVGSNPLGITITPDGKTVYVANNDSPTVSTFETGTPTAVRSISARFTGMYDIESSSDGSAIATTTPRITTGGSAGTNIVGRIYTDSGEWLVARSGGDPCYGMTYSSKTMLFYISRDAGSAGFLTNINSSGRDIQVGKQPRGIRASPDGSTVYVANSGDKTVSVVDVEHSRLLATVPVGSVPVSVAVSSTFAYVANSGDDTISIIDTSTKTVTGTITVGTNPQAIAVSAQGKSVYVANADSNTVSVIDAASKTVIATLPTGRTPSGIAVSPDGGTIYVTNKDDNTVSIIPTGRTETSTTG